MEGPEMTYRKSILQLPGNGALSHGARSFGRRLLLLNDHVVHA